MADPIDRQELRKAMYHEAFETDSDEQRWDSGCWIRYKLFERILNSMPSAQPEHKTGRWKGEGMGDYRCSWCGEVSHPQTNFCPNCGADMRGGVDGADGNG